MSFVPSDGQATKCLGCGKTVYPNEAIRACNGSWHKTCLKCTTCQMILNLKTVESFENKPYCKTHKPNAAHTQVTDSVAVKQATSAPKAARAVQGVKRDQRTTFMPGQMQPITTASAATNTSTPAASAPSSAAKSTPPPAATTSSVPRTSSNPSVPRTSAGGTGAFVPSDGQATKCLGCAKTVYPNEAIRACNGSWHKTCLKCTTCQLTLNLKTAESFQNKPYCKTHKPEFAHTQVTDSVAVKQATSAPKAARAVQGVKRDQRRTFMPGQMQPVTNTEVVKGFNSTGNNNNNNNAPSANFHQHSAPAPGAHHHHQDSYENTSTDQYYEQSEDAYEQAQDAYEQAQDAYEQAQDGYDYGQQDYEYGEQAGEYVEQAAGGGEDDWD